MNPKTATYTPGPWNTGNLDRTTPTVFCGGRLIAEVHDLCVPGQHGEDVANARLIAAAPTMYETLLSIVNEYPTLANDEDAEGISGAEMIDFVGEIAFWVVNDLRPTVEGKQVQHGR